MKVEVPKKAEPSPEEPASKKQKVTDTASSYVNVFVSGPSGLWSRYELRLLNIEGVMPASV
jgi:hypothetical protein